MVQYSCHLEGCGKPNGERRRDFDVEDSTATMPEARRPAASDVIRCWPVVKLFRRFEVFFLLFFFGEIFVPPFFSVFWMLG